mmetsp:Transcript_24535/g.62132  ORF Transcript_24535/g.62132 Transcript_24535/m.62132 type:complete len:178 (-) Transcript_24535:881-1414(-)
MVTAGVVVVVAMKTEEAAATTSTIDGDVVGMMTMKVGEEVVGMGMRIAGEVTKIAAVAEETTAVKDMVIVVKGEEIMMVKDMVIAVEVEAMTGEEGDSGVVEAKKYLIEACSARDSLMEAMTKCGQDSSSKRGPSLSKTSKLLKKRKSQLSALLSQKRLSIRKKVQMMLAESAGNWL